MKIMVIINLSVTPLIWYFIYYFFKGKVEQDPDWHATSKLNSNNFFSLIHFAGSTGGSLKLHNDTAVLKHNCISCLAPRDEGHCRLNKTANRWCLQCASNVKPKEL